MRTHTHTIAPTIAGILSNMPASRRLTVMDALTTKPLFRGGWLGPYNSGCFLVVATQAITGVSRNKIFRDPVQVTGSALGINRGRVRAAYHEWDDLSDPQLRQFLDGIRQDAARLRARQAFGAPVQGVRRAASAVRELVTA